MSTRNTSERSTGLLRWATLAAVPSLTLMVLVPGLNTLDPQGSLEGTIATLGQWLAVGLATWLLASQILYTIAAVARLDWAQQVLRPVTLPFIRRIVAGATSAALTFGAAGSVLANPHPQVEVVEIAEEANLRTESTPTPTLEPLETTEEAASLPEGSYAAPLTWLVRPGDHLWSIAEEHLTIVMERQPTLDEHSRYWALLVETARPVIRSDDPDLIHPGEQIPLPALLDAAVRP